MGLRSIPAGIAHLRYCLAPRLLHLVQHRLGTGRAGLLEMVLENLQASNGSLDVAGGYSFVTVSVSLHLGLTGFTKGDQPSLHVCTSKRDQFLIGYWPLTFEGAG